MTLPINIRQPRLTTGFLYQEAVAKYLQEKYLDRIEILSSAKISSKAPDLIFELDSNIVQMEVKGYQSKYKPITFLDKSIRRGSSHELLDKMANIVSEGKHITFEKLIDFHRAQDKSIGYPDDAGVVNKSGKLPQNLHVTDNKSLMQIHDLLLNHLRQRNDSYFSIYSNQTQEVQIYFTGAGVNILDAPFLPPLTKATLSTYGGSYKGAMRVAFKIKLSN